MARILVGDAIEQMRTLPDESVQCCVTSPPYWGLRDYGVDGQIGLEKTPAEYVERLVGVFREVRRVLKADGTCWVNLGDSYAGGGQNSGSRPEGLSEKQRSNAGCRYERMPVPQGLKPKDLVGIPWRVAFALQADGWYLRQDIIWHKPNPMPESVRDRCTKAHEYIFMLSKSARYFYDADAIKEPRTSNEDGTRNKRSVWTVAPKPFHGAHFATFPPALIEPCILAGSRPGDTVLDPFGGAGTTALVAAQHGRFAVLCELNPAYAHMATERLAA